MYALRPRELLEIWDQGRDRHPVDRALVVLAFACPEFGWEELGELPVGERNRRLLATRAATFGARLDMVTRCPSCAEEVEFEFEFPLERFAEGEPRELELVSAGGERLPLRLPDSRDLAAIATLEDPAAAELALIERCVDRVAEGEELGELEAAFAEAVEAHDPLAAITFPASCPACSRPWRASLDPVDYLWRELAARVRRIVREVDALARAYGWSEAEILALGAGRRRLYLEQIGASA